MSTDIPEDFDAAITRLLIARRVHRQAMAEINAQLLGHVAEARVADVTEREIRAIFGSESIPRSRQLPWT